MALQLLSADELKALLTNRETAEKIVPGSSHMGIQYTLNGTTAVYKQSDYPNLYFFETSTSEGGSHRVLKFEKPSSVYDRSGSSGPLYTVASITQEIQAAYPGATDITFLKSYKDSETVSPSMTYSTVANLGHDSLLMGESSICNLANSFVLGKSLYVGAEGDTSVSNSVFGHDNVLRWSSDYTSIKGYDIVAQNGASYNSIFGRHMMITGGCGMNVIIGENFDFAEGTYGNRIFGSNIKIRSGSTGNDVSGALLNLYNSQYSDIKGKSTTLTASSSYSTIFGQNINVGNVQASALYTYNGLSIGNVIYSNVVTSGEKSEAAQILRSNLAGSSVDMPNCNLEYASVIGCDIFHKPMSEGERLWINHSNPPTTYSSSIQHSLLVGDDTLYIGGNTLNSGLRVFNDRTDVAASQSNYVGYWTAWKTQGNNSTAYVFRTDVTGNGNYIGLATQRIHVYGENNYVPSNSSDISIYGSYFNTYFCFTNGEYSYAAHSDNDRFIHAKQTEPWADIANTVTTIEDLRTIISNSGNFGYNNGTQNVGGVVIGTGEVTDKNNKTYSFNGITAYIKCDAGVISGIVNDGGKDHTYQTPLYPSGNTNILSIGDYNSLPSDVYDVVLCGDDLTLWGGNVRRSVIIADNLHLNTGGDGYNLSKRPEMFGTIFIDTVPKYGLHKGDLGRFTTMNYWDSTVMATEFHYSVNDALLFINSNRHRDDRHWGVFGSGDITNWFAANPVSTVSSYIDKGSYQQAHKPDATMVYTGGIALLGLADSTTVAPGYTIGINDSSAPSVADVSGFGLLKIGSLYSDKTSPTEGCDYVAAYTNNSANYHGTVILTPGTNKCPYGHMPLIVQPHQEFDGTFHIGAGKIHHEGIDIDEIIYNLTADQVTKLKQKLGIS